MKALITTRVLVFLNKELGLSYYSIHLGIKLSIKNKTSLPLALWSYSLISTDELYKLYDFLWS